MSNSNEEENTGTSGKNEAEQVEVEVGLIDILIPPGKLHVFFNSTSYNTATSALGLTLPQTQVVEVMNDSPLVGMNQVGDIIISVDDGDVRETPCYFIRFLLMNKKENAVRKITVFRGDPYREKEEGEKENDDMKGSNPFTHVRIPLSGSTIDGERTVFRSKVQNQEKDEADANDKEFN